MVYVESNSTEHVQPANILATIALYVSSTSRMTLGYTEKAKDEYSDWQMRTLLSHGTKLTQSHMRMLRLTMLDMDSIAFLLGSSRIHQKDCVRCVGKVGPPMRGRWTMLKP